MICICSDTFPKGSGQAVPRNGRREIAGKTKREGGRLFYPGVEAFF